MESIRLLKFDALAYGQIYRDLDGLSRDRLEAHYSEFGRGEGRCPMPLFDPVFYAEQTGIPLDQAEDDYRNRERLEADPHPLFSVEFYRQQVGDVTDPVLHYMESGWRSGVDPHPLFFSRYYCQQWDEPTGRDPLSDYVMTGWRVGRKANPLFEREHYIAESPDLATLETDPLVHYATLGWKERRSPHPLFDLDYYASQTTDDSDPLGHYLRVGHDLGLDPHPLFSTDYYFAQSPDIAGTSMNALAHFFSFGGEELRQHHPLFDPRWYQERTGCGGIPVVHYLEAGGRVDPSPEFNTRYYLEHSESARRSALTPLVHWVVEQAPRGQSFSSLPLDEVVIEMLLIGQVARATAVMRQRHRGSSDTGRLVLPFRMGEEVAAVDDGWLVGGLPGVLSSDAVLVGCAPVDRPTVIAQGGSVVITRSSGGIASAAHMTGTIENVRIVESSLESDEWTWYLRCLPALRAAIAEDQSANIVVTAELEETAAEMTQFVLAGCTITTVGMGSAIRARNVVVVPHHSLGGFSPSTPPPREGLALVLDRTDPITASGRASLISAVVAAGGRVVDTSWGAPAIADCVEQCNRLIGLASLPMLAFLAAPGSALVALDDAPPDHARRDIAAKGLSLEIVNLPVTGLPADQHHRPQLDPATRLQQIVGGSR